MSKQVTKPTHDTATAARVASWLADIALLGEPRQALVLRLREMVLALDPAITEEVKYGGLLFSGAAPFCGVFFYAGHVSLELGRGAELPDPAGALEGSGKLRRHLKLRSLEDVRERQVSMYLDLAYQACR